MTPALDALLKEVEKIPRWEDVTGVPFVPLAPRLAAMLRVAVEALAAAEELAAEALSYTPDYFREKWRMDERLAEAQAALARIEQIAAGES